MTAATYCTRCGFGLCICLFRCSKCKQRRDPLSKRCGCPLPLNRYQHVITGEKRDQVSPAAPPAISGTVYLRNPNTGEAELVSPHDLHNWRIVGEVPAAP